MHLLSPVFIFHTWATCHFFPNISLCVHVHVWWVEKDALKFYRIAENSLSTHYADVIPKRVHKSISACEAKSCAANGQLIQLNDHLCLSKLSVLMNFHWNQAFMQPNMLQSNQLSSASFIPFEREYLLLRILPFRSRKYRRRDVCVSFDFHLARLHMLAR